MNTEYIKEKLRLLEDKAEMLTLEYREAMGRIAIEKEILQEAEGE